MKIILNSNSSNDNKPIRFTCSRCGTVFDADRNEYDMSVNFRNEPYCVCSCPKCNSTVYYYPF